MLFSPQIVARSKRAPGSGFGGGGGGGSYSAEVTQYLARTSGLDATHTNALQVFIDGLVTDGIWSKFDWLHWYAHQDSTNALINLTSSSFNGTSNGSPTFTADRGFTGVDSSTTVYIDTGFNPASGSPQYALNSAHLCVWSLTSANSTLPSIGADDNVSSSYIFCRYTDNNTYNRINNGHNLLGSYGTSTALGHFIGVRDGASSCWLYQDGTANGTHRIDSSNAVVNANHYTLAINNVGTPLGSGRQIAMASMGSLLDATQAGNYRTRCRTLGTALGVP